MLLLSLIPPFFAGTDYEYFIRLIGNFFIYGIMALGVNFVLFFLGLFELGYAAFFAISSYTSAILMTKGVSLFFAVPASIAICLLLRSVLIFPVLRLRGDYLAIVTLGFGEITRIFLNNIDNLTNGPKGLPRPGESFGFNPSETTLYYVFLSILILSVLFTKNIKNSRIGRAFLAMKEDETAASFAGINFENYRMLGFIISGVFAGMAGAFYPLWLSHLTPESFTFWESITYVGMVVLGGIGNVWGVLSGCLILYGIPEILRDVLTDLYKVRFLIFGLCLIFFIIFRPHGLFRK